MAKGLKLVDTSAVTQRRYRRDARRPPRRDYTPGQARAGEQRDDRQEHGWVGRVDPFELAPQQPARGDRTEHAEREADDDEPHAARNNQPDDLAPAGAERETHTKLARPLCHRVREDTIEAYDGQHQRDEREGGKQSTPERR